jgi:hypothetical protein
MDSSLTSSSAWPLASLELLGALNCKPLDMAAAPAVAAYGYVGAPDEDLQRGLALERRFLGTPELLGAGEQIVAVFRKRQRSAFP